MGLFKPVSKRSEIYFESFEEPGGWDDVLTGYDNTNSHSGKYSGKITKTTAGGIYSRSTKPITISITAPTKYRYSGWIYSNGPSTTIYFFMRRAGEVNYYTYLDFIGTFVKNKWVYLEKEFTVPADAITLDLRIDNSSGRGTVWFDDLRLHPSDAIMTTYTYDALVGMTSECDQNKHIKYFEYDALQRLKIVRDQDKNILKRFCYSYSGQQSDCSTIIQPLSTTINSINVGVSGYTAVYTNIVTNLSYSFSVPSTGGTLGTIPVGNYNITISKTGQFIISQLFSVCSGSFISGSSPVSFYNINVRSYACNTLQIDDPTF